MKKVALFLMFGLISYTILANHDGEKPKPVVSNYNEVLSEIVYPENCRTDLIEGTVLVELNVNKKGGIRSYKILDSPNEELTLAVEEALPKLDFEAPEINGRSVSSKILIPVEFRLSH